MHISVLYRLAFLAVLLVILLISSLQPSKAETRIGGTTTCRQYVASTGAARANTDTWVLGFASGANSVASLVWGRDFLSGQSRSSILDQISTLCTASPDQTVSAAASDYLKTLKNR